jgi:hypothetical protein
MFKYIKEHHSMNLHCDERIVYERDISACVVAVLFGHEFIGHNDETPLCGNKRVQQNKELYLSYNTIFVRCLIP